MKIILKRFIENFYENIERELNNFLKSEKLREFNIEKFKIEIIDYKNGVMTPVLEKMKLVSSEVKLYVKNGSDNPYLVEEVFHPFSLSVLVDKLLNTKYTKLLEEFYFDIENEIVKMFNLKNTTELKFEDIFTECLAITELYGKFQVVEGKIIRIFSKGGRAFFEMLLEDERSCILHLTECHLPDILPILNGI